MTWLFYVLKTINSSFFNLPNKIGSVQQAVSLMGIKSVINVVNSLSIRSSLSDDNIVKMTRFWDSAMDIAAASTVISEFLQMAEPDESYTLGLFHNCGNILLMRKFENFPEILELSYAEKSRRVVDLENECLQTNHAVIGYYAAKSWHLPRDFCNVIADHHNASEIFNTDINQDYDPAKKTLLAILKMAEHICGTHLTLGKQAIDHEWEAVKDNVLDFVGLSVLDFDDIAAEMVGLGIGSGTSYFDTQT